MSEETLKNNSEKNKPPLESEVTFEELDCKVDKFSAGDIETSYELDPESILNRWHNIFSTKIKEHNVGEEELKRMAEEFLQESKKVKEWLQRQPDKKQYLIVHFIHPSTGEHIIVHKGNEPARIYGIFARFDNEGVRLEHDLLFREE